MIIGQYKAIYMPTHPRRLQNNCVYEHILIVEEKLGRPLKDGEIVHHRDMNKMNNSPDNLIVFVNRMEHTKFHRYNCDENLLTQNEDGSYYCSIKNSHECPICGQKKDSHAKLCKSCYDRYLNRKVIDRPSREELKQKIRNTAFTKIGKEYNVSDNAIRKWCKYYNLPFKSKEIKQYTDEEWKKI